MPIYGIVTRFPKPNEELWTTQAFDSLQDPEGGYLYEFSESNAWQQPIMTRKDMEFFQSRPKDYSVQNIVYRPSRPQRPVEERPLDGSALMSEQRVQAPEPKTVPIPSQAQEHPKRRGPRPRIEVPQVTS